MLGLPWRKRLPDHLPAVKADPRQSSKCLENLISNAIKYAGKTHWLGVRAEAVNGNQSAEVQVSVEDKGKGISAEDLPHIFEPFYRVQEVRDGQIRGVGLGLHLVKRMMEGMGGRVSVASEVGRGTRFVLHFPVAQANEAERGAEPYRADRKTGQAAWLPKDDCGENVCGMDAKILIVEDEAGLGNRTAGPSAQRRL